MRLALYAVPLLVACAAPLDAVGEASSSETAGTTTLTVTAPPGISAVVRAERADKAGTEFGLDLDTPRVVTPGTYCVWTRIGAFDTARDCGVTVEANAPATYALGVVMFTRSTTDLLLGIDWPPSDNALVRDFLLHTGPLAHAAAKSTYDYIKGDDITFTVAAGQVVTVDIASIVDHASLRLLPSPTRALPTLEPSETPVRGARIELGSQTFSGVRFTALDAPLLARGRTAGKLSLTYASYAGLDLDIALAAPGAPVKAFPLGRLEVPQVEVAQPDGTILRVPGSCSIFAKSDGSTKAVQKDMPLGFGFDVPYGDYDVTVSYRDPVSSTDRVQTFTVRLP
jgi:hypothetical protein